MGFWRKQLERVNGEKGSPQLPKSKKRLFLAKTTCSSSVQFSSVQFSSVQLSTLLWYSVQSRVHGTQLVRHCFQLTCRGVILQVA